MATLNSFAQRLLTTVDAYIRDQSKLWKMNIPKEINNIIYLFYKILIDSNILTEEENCKLYEMVLKELQTKNEVKALNFDLIYRGTEHGFGFKDYWDKCENIKPAFVIIETTGNKVCGGCTSVGFRKDRGSNYRDPDAFIYSIRTNDSKYPPKIFRVIHANSAMGFWFGYLGSFSGSGIWLRENCNKPGTNTGIAGLNYVPAGNTWYLNAGKRVQIQVKEIELFQIVSE